MKVCVIGAGKLGMAVAEALHGSGNEVTVLDINESRIESAGNALDVFVVNSDALQVEALQAVGIKDYDMAVSCTESDENNMVICALAKHLGCARTMARVRAPQHVYQTGYLKEVFNIDYILNPNLACAEYMHKYLTDSHSLPGGIFTQDGISILEFNINKMPELIGKEIRQTNDILNGKLIGAISRNGKIIVPKGLTVLEENDTVYMVMHEEESAQIAAKVLEDKKDVKNKRIVIAGGGKTGYFLAEMLLADGAAVKIIDSDLERCKTLSESLDKATVIHAQIADANVLEEENIKGADAFVSVTGLDEENLLMSMLVKQSGVNKVVAKVSRKTYQPILNDFGDIAAINPQELITSEVLSYIRRNGVVLFSKVINGQAEFREIQATGDMPITKSSLSELNIPAGIIVLSVKRGKSTIIPNGKTQISAGDRVLLLSLLSQSSELEALFTNANKSIL